MAPGVNLLQVHTNYEIGRWIVEREQGGADRAQYGKEVIQELAERLMSELGNEFSKSDLEYMRRFYLAYPGRNIQIATAEDPMNRTPYHAKYFAHELTKRHSSGFSVRDFENSVQ